MASITLQISVVARTSPGPIRVHRLSKPSERPATPATHHGSPSQVATPTDLRDWRDGHAAIDRSAVDHLPADPGNALMLALQQGERQALDRLFALYTPRLYSFILRIVIDPVVAEDLVQETWMTLYEHRMSYQPSHRFSTWLFTIGRRKALSELRRRSVRSVVRSLTQRRRGEESVDLEVAQRTYCTPEASADGAIVAAIVERALARLNPQQREIVMLRDVEGLENDEIAQVLGWNVKPGALRKRIFDAREAFRRAMLQEGYPDQG